MAGHPHDIDFRDLLLRGARHEAGPQTVASEIALEVRDRHRPLDNACDVSSVDPPLLQPLFAVAVAAGQCERPEHRPLEDAGGPSHWRSVVTGHIPTLRTYGIPICRPAPSWSVFERGIIKEQRLPIGRPWTTLAIDVYSRMVVGFYISLDPPGAIATGLCIAHAVLPKEAWLSKRRVAGQWPCWGFPARIHLDNAKEFHGVMLRRACDQYGINLEYRPPAQPHTGGHIERLLGTLMKALHELPGATYSNPKERGDYESEARATMTLAEIEQWLTEYIVGVYHARQHRAISTSPLQRWTAGVLAREHSATIARPMDEERIRLDFLPFTERTVQPYGVAVDGIRYYSDVLRRFIGATEGQAELFVPPRSARH